MRRVRAWALWARITCAAVAVVATGCGGGASSVTAKSAADLSPEQIDQDPLALLPGSAIALANVDARAFYDSNSFGGQLGKITEKLVPLGDEANFHPSKDVDRIVVASYSMQGIDVAAVLSGRFDADKIDKLAESQTPTKGGGTVVKSTYAGRALYTVNNVGFVILTPHTALAGTETGIRRVLDRMRDGKATSRSLPGWMVETIETKGAATALAADFSAQAISNVAVGSVALPWLKGLQTARLIGNFHDPGVNAAGTLTYENEDEARAGADGVRQISNLAAMLSMTGVVPRLQNLEVTTDKSSVSYKFAVDDQALRALLAVVPQYLGS